MSREKKERKQFGSVTASLVIAFFVVSSGVFLNVKYTFGEFIEPFALTTHEFTKDGFIPYPSFSLEFVSNTPEYKWVDGEVCEEDYQIAEGGCRGDIIRANKQIYAQLGIVLKDGELLDRVPLKSLFHTTGEQVRSESISDVYQENYTDSASKNSYTTSSFSQQQMQNVVIGGGSTMAGGKTITYPIALNDYLKFIKPAPTKKVVTFTPNFTEKGILVFFQSDNLSTKNRNVFLGQAAGLNTRTKDSFGSFLASGDANTFVGYYSGHFNSGGAGNTFVGYKSGWENSGNFDLQKGITEGTGNTYVGLQAGAFNVSGNFNTFLGQTAGLYNLKGSNNVFMGSQAGLKNLGSGNVFIGNEAGYDEKGSDKLAIGNSKDRLPLIYGDFKDRIVVLNGRVRAENYESLSDARMKTDIHTIENALDKVSRMRGVSYNWKDRSRSGSLQIGVVAQEVESVVPEVVSEDSEGVKAVAYSKLVALLIEAVKELKEVNGEIVAENRLLKQKVKDIQSKNMSILKENQIFTEVLLSLEERVDKIETRDLARFSLEKGQDHDMVARAE